MSEPLDDALEAALAASRGMFGLIVRSVADDAPDLTIAQYRLLVFLGQSGARRPGDLAIELNVSPATATRMSKRMEAAGFVERHRDPDDARSILVMLNPKGRSLIDSVMDRRRAAFAYTLQGMSDGDLRVLAPVLTRFAETAG